LIKLPSLVVLSLKFYALDESISEMLIECPHISPFIYIVSFDGFGADLIPLVIE